MESRVLVPEPVVVPYRMPILAHPRAGQRNLLAVIRWLAIGLVALLLAVGLAVAAWAAEMPATGAAADDGEVAGSATTVTGTTVPSWCGMLVPASMLQPEGCPDQDANEWFVGVIDG